MRQTVRFIVVKAAVWMLTAGVVMAQKVDDERMERDIEVAENVLSTLIKQKFEKKNIWSINVEGKYMEGYGVTFRVPNDFSFSWFEIGGGPGKAVVVGEGFSYTLKSGDKEKEVKRIGVNAPSSRDSLRQVYHQRIVEAAKEFLVDYGDFLTQLKPEERITITNRGEEYHYYYPGSNRRTLLSVEATKGDLTQFRQGKLTRDQVMAKIKVVNTESEEEMAPDLELLSSILERLYRDDLSKTYFTNENIYYERLKDFGVIYYMQVYSSRPDEFRKHKMPTLDMDDVDQATRDKKVTELYPIFEKDIKENLLEYSRTLKSLKDDEQVVLNIRLTTCEKCGIPSTLELSVKNAVLKDYSTGALAKDAAMAKINAKKGPNQ